MSNQPTLPVVVNLPNYVIEDIEKLIETGLFSNKPDFVMCAVRNELKYDIEPILTSDYEERSVTLLLAQAFPAELLGEVKTKYSKTAPCEEYKAIMIKAPPQIVRLLDYETWRQGFPGRNKYVQYCVENYMDQLIENWNPAKGDEFISIQMQMRKQLRGTLKDLGKRG